MIEKEQLDRIEKKIDNIEDIASERKFTAKTKVIHLFFVGLIAALFYSAIVLHVYISRFDSLPAGLFHFGILTAGCYVIFLLVLGAGTSDSVGNI